MGPYNSFAHHDAQARGALNNSRAARKTGLTCKKRLGYWVVLVAALAACGQDSEHIKKVQGLTRRLAEIAGQANGAAPALVDSDTRLDGARAGPGPKVP